MFKMNNRKSYVYKITCKITGEYYFGSSFNAKSDRYWGGGTKIRERVAQYGKENFVKEILGEFDDRTIAHQVENQYIEKFLNDEKCLNQHLDHKFGTYSDESRTNLSAATRGEKNPRYGKIVSDETRAKLSAVNRGKHRTDETRAKISAVNRGKIVSDDTRAKMSAANIGEKNPMYGKHWHWRKNPVTGKREWYE